MSGSSPAGTYHTSPNLPDRPIRAAEPQAERDSAVATATRRTNGGSTHTAETLPPGLRVIEPKLLLPRVQPGVLRRARLLEMLDSEGGPR